MGSSTSPTSKWSGNRWTASRRAARPEDAAKVQEMLQENQPPFWAAVVADAEIAARYRGEHNEFRSRLDALGQVLRLMWVTDSFLAQVCYRAKVACRAHKVPLVPAVLHRLAITCGQVSIGDLAVVRPGVYLPHGQVVIDGLTYVGTGVVLRPFVTLGLRDGDMFGPRIGPRTWVGTGAKVFGPIRVGSDCQIGANAVVTRNVPKGRVAVGVPAHVVP